MAGCHPRFFYPDFCLWLHIVQSNGSVAFVVGKSELALREEEA